MQDFRVMSWNVENLFQPGDVVSKIPRKIMEQSTYEARLATRVAKGRIRVRSSTRL